MDLMQNYRNRLVSDVVTGKISTIGVTIELHTEFELEVDDDLTDNEEVDDEVTCADD